MRADEPPRLAQRLWRNGQLKSRAEFRSIYATTCKPNLLMIFFFFFEPARPDQMDDGHKARNDSKTSLKARICSNRSNLRADAEISFPTVNQCDRCEAPIPHESDVIGLFQAGGGTEDYRGHEYFMVPQCQTSPVFLPLFFPPRSSLGRLYI